MQSHGELIANDEAAEQGTPGATTAYEDQDRRWNRARELWLENNKRKCAEIVRLILKEEGLPNDEHYDAVRKMLYRAEKRNGRYDQDSQ